MRCNDVIKIEIKVPIPINEPDDNRYIYSKEVINNSIENFKKCPLIYRSKDKEESIVIGNIDTIKLSNDNYYIEAEGNIFFGGTDEEAKVMDNIITNMNITAFGICRE